MTLYHIFQNFQYEDPNEPPQRPRDRSYERSRPKVSDEAAATRSKPSNPSHTENPEARLFLFQVLDLVDRYWNGSKSLHKNNKFKSNDWDFLQFKEMSHNIR